MAPPIVLATRKSALALAQAELACAALQAAHPDRTVELLPMSTTGDERLQWSLELEGGKGLFTSELERAVLDGRADYAVHSGKDLPTEFLEGLEVVGFLPREDPRDVLVRREEAGEALAVIATSSPRRRAQLAARFPAATWTTIRGNVETRLRKIAAGEADATVLAAAGLNRLGIARYDGLVFEPLATGESIPAAAQGAIAIQGRGGEAAPWEGVICPVTTAAVSLERTALGALGGGCHSASAAYVAEGVLHLFEETLGAHQLALGEGAPDIATWIATLRASKTS